MEGRNNEVKKVITNDFLQNLLRKYENNQSIIVNNVLFKEATNKGDNYASDMFRVTVDYNYTKGTIKNFNEKKSLIIKFEPMEEGLNKDFVS